MGYNETIANFEDSLKQLNTSYVDLYMFHWPGLFPQDLPMLDPPHLEVSNAYTAQVVLSMRGREGREREGGRERERRLKSMSARVAGFSSFSFFFFSTSPSCIVFTIVSTGPLQPFN